MPKRRANGEGSIRKRSDGRWEGRYTAGQDPETGKPISRNVLGKTQVEVKDKLRQAIGDCSSIDFTKTEDYTLGEWLKLWLENYGDMYLRASSQVNYRGFLKNQIAKTIGDIKLKKLTNRQIQKFYKDMLDHGRVQRRGTENKPTGLSPKSVRNIHFFISHALDRAVEEKLISANPAFKCVLPKKEKKEMKTLPLEDMNRFFDEAKKSGVYELYLTEMATGMRRGELLGLKWSDINFKENTIFIQRQVTRLDGIVQETPLKTDNAYRSVIIPPEVATVLQEKKEREAGFSEYVFSSQTGGAISPDGVLRKLHRVLERAGLPMVRFHDLRHTFSTMALQNGVDVKTLSGILGHYSAGFTLDTYGHVTTQMKVDAANKVGQFLSATMS